MRSTRPAQAILSFVLLLALTAALAAPAAARVAPASSRVVSDFPTITASATGAGTITPSGVVRVNYGYNQTFTMVADPGARLLEVVVDGESVGRPSSYTFYQVTGDHTIVASFTTKTFKISAIATGAGTISPSGDVLVPYGEDATFTMKAEEGSHLVDLLVDGVSRGTPATYTFRNVTNDHTIYAMFAADSVIINAKAGPHGSIAPSGDVRVNVGADQTFAIKPDPGYRVADVLVDGKSVGALATYTFTKVDKAHTISATFIEGAVVITASAGAHGSIAPSGQVSVAIGADQTFTITPDQGYFISDVLVDGASVGAVSTYTFVNVTVPHTIAASFLAFPPPVIKLSPFLTPGLIIGKGFGEQVLFTVGEYRPDVAAFPGALFARAASPPADVTVSVLEPGSSEPRGVPVTWSALPTGGSAASGTLPTDSPGDYVLTVAVADPTSGTATQTATYRVAGVYAPVEGLPTSGTVDVSSGSTSSRKSFPLRLRLTNTSGGPVLKAKPRLYVFDLATGIRVFRAKGYFKNLGHGKYRFVWFPKQMKPFAAWRGTSRPAQLVIPLYTSGPKKGTKTLGDIVVKW